MRCRHELGYKSFLCVSSVLRTGPIAVTFFPRRSAIVYAWTDELDLTFEKLTISVTNPAGVHYGELKLDPAWDPLRKDPRFDKLLAELEPRD
jgi:hypothetical protein